MYSANLYFCNKLKPSKYGYKNRLFVFSLPLYDKFKKEKKNV